MGRRGMGRLRGQGPRMKFVVTLAVLATAFGQNQPARFTTDVRLVRLLVNVKNPKGELVGSLEKDQFAVFDDNGPQEIKVFERYTTTPLSVAVMVDTSGSTRIDWQT